MTDLEIKQLVDEFEIVTVQHPKQQAAHERLAFSCIHSPSPALIVLAGPTGTGKSTILRKFAAEYLAALAPEMTSNAALRPIAYTMATASGNFAFDWKRLYMDTSDMIDDPFGIRGAKGHDFVSPCPRLPSETTSASLMRMGLEREFDVRGVRLWIIDEAHHIIRGSAGSKPGGPLDGLKSLAQTTSCKLLLCGTYDLPDYLTGSGQIARRSDCVQLNRYRWTVEKERHDFVNAAHSILKKLPSHPHFPAVMENLEYFYVRSVGSVGVFKDWASRAYAHHLCDGSTSLKLDDFDNTALSARQLAVINQEVLDGEARYSDDRSSPDAGLTRSILNGLAAAPTRKVKRGRRATKSSSQQIARKPGNRLPARDKVEEASPCT